MYFIKYRKSLDVKVKKNVEMKNILFTGLFLVNILNSFSQSITFSGNVFGFLGDKLILTKKASKNISFEGPISSVRISIKSDSQNFDILSDVTGSFSFKISKKEKYLISLYKEGYSTASINLEYNDAGSKTEYVVFSFILRKGENSNNDIGNVLISDAGKFYFKVNEQPQKKASNDVMLSNRILFEKCAEINNIYSKKIEKHSEPHKTKIQKEIVVKTEEKIIYVKEPIKEDPLSKAILSSNNAIIFNPSASIEDLKKQLNKSKSILSKLDVNDKNYSILLTQIKNAEFQIKSKTQLIEVQKDVISNSKKMIIFLSILCVIIFASVIMLFYFLGQKKKFNLELKKAHRTVTNINKRLVSSIRYAAIIQSNFFRDKNLLQDLFPHSFIFNKPKDLLSGDFYWFSYKHNHRVLVVADCTGHGVPGSLLTMLGHSLLDEIVNVKAQVVPSRILHELNKAVISAFSKNNQLEFGIDITVICMKDGRSDELVFSGLTNGLYQFSGQQLIYHKVSPKAIGSNFNEDEVEDKIIKIKTGDCIYLTSDGFCDQFREINGVLEKYNITRMNSLLIKISQADNFSQAESELNDELNNWKGKKDQTDDVIVVGIKF